MNSVILSAFLGILLVACVQSQDNSKCSLKCRDGEYCSRREIGRLALESCRRYRRKGSLCNDRDLICKPELECKARRQGSSLRYCMDKDETTTSGTTMTMPPTPSISTDIPKVTTDMSTDIPTDVPTDIPTDKPTDIPTDVPTDITTDATEENTDATEENTDATEENTDATEETTTE